MTFRIARAMTTRMFNRALRSPPPSPVKPPERRPFCESAKITAKGRRLSASALGDLLARRQQAKIAGLLQWSECEVTIAILTDDDSPVHLIGTRAWIE